MNFPSAYGNGHIFFNSCFVLSSIIIHSFKYAAYVAILNADLLDNAVKRKLYHHSAILNIKTLFGILYTKNRSHNQCNIKFDWNESSFPDFCV